MTFQSMRTVHAAMAHRGRHIWRSGHWAPLGLSYLLCRAIPNPILILPDTVHLSSSCLAVSSGANCQEGNLLSLVKTGLSRTTAGLAPIYELANLCMWDWLHLPHHSLTPARFMHPGTPHIVITTSNCVAYGAHFYNLNVLHCTFAAMVAEHFVGRNAANTEHMRAPLLLFKGLDAILEEHTTFYGDEGWPASCQSLSTRGILTGMGVLTIVYQASNICATLHGLSFLFTICLSSHPGYQRMHQIQEIYGKNHLNLLMTTATLRIGPEYSMICAAQKITVAAGLRKYCAELKLGHGTLFRGSRKTKPNTSRPNVE